MLGSLLVISFRLLPSFILHVYYIPYMIVCQQLLQRNLSFLQNKRPRLKAGAVRVFSKDAKYSKEYVITYLSKSQI
nr:MAG TPA: hypothetical protein [Caudoviricetes sp.]